MAGKRHLLEREKEPAAEEGPALLDFDGLDVVVGSANQRTDRESRTFCTSLLIFPEVVASLHRHRHGGVGDPTDATAEKGRRWLEAGAEVLGAFLKEFSAAEVGERFPF
jgi:creatinine amidohydrolase/Fe(II)-dependent formamide hydrolase-like protein